MRRNPAAAGDRAGVRRIPSRLVAVKVTAVKPNAPLRLTFLLLAALACATGCEKPEAIEAYQAPKEPPPATRPVAGDAVPVASAAPTAAAAKPIEYTVPAEWKEIPPGPVLYASFRIAPNDPKALFTVSTLASNAGMLLANVNRWQRQLKLPESPESDSAKLTKEADVPAGRGLLVDLVGPDGSSSEPRQRMLAAILEHGPRTWYLKMVGPAELVAAQQSNFDAVLKSVRFPAGTAETADTGTRRRQHRPRPERLAKWATPAERRQDAEPKPPRTMSFQVGPGAGGAEVTVIKLPQESSGSILDNINRWRGQVGLEPVGDITAVNRGSIEQVTIAGGDALLFDFAGPKADAPDKRLIVAMTLRGHDLWFIKLLGPAATVAGRRTRSTSSSRRWSLRRRTVASGGAANRSWSVNEGSACRHPERSEGLRVPRR